MVFATYRLFLFVPYHVELTLPIHGLVSPNTWLWTEVFFNRRTVDGDGSWECMVVNVLMGRVVSCTGSLPHIQIESNLRV